MSKRESYEKETKELLIPIAERFGVRIYDVEYVKEGKDYYLRSYIDKDGGVTIDDCEKVSRALSDELDAKDFISDPYIMEVSSPGLGRVLKKDSHLSYSIGESVDIRFYAPLDGQKEISGILKSFDKAFLIIETTEGEKSIDRSKIASVSLTLDI